MDPVNSPAPYQNDEIDLFELFESLWKEKVLIVASTVLITLGGGIYAFSLKPTYEATIAIYDALPESRQLLNGLRFSEVKNINVDEFVAFLNSSDQLRSLTRSKTWQAATAGSEITQEDSVRRLISSKAFSATKVRDKKNQNSFQVWELKWLARTYTEAEKELTDYVFNGLESFSRFKVDQYENLRTTELKNLNSRYQAIYKEREHVRADNLAQLEEALAVAQKLNIVEPADLALMAKVSARTAASSVELVNSSDKNPLYLRGTKLLTAEIDVLKSRKNEEPFSDTLQELRSSINLLKAEIYPSTVDYGFLRESAIGNPQRVAPKRKMIVALSGVVGGFLAILFVLIRNAARNRKAA